MKRPNAKQQKSLGIISMCEFANSNGTITCLVELAKVDRVSNGANFRKFSQSHANKIKANFNQMAVRNPILVWSKHSNCLITLDGRHTIDACLACGYQTISADVHFQCNEQQAAAVFSEITQNSKRMGVWDAHNASLIAEYQSAIEIQTAMDKPKVKWQQKELQPSLLQEAQKKGVVNDFLKVLAGFRDKQKDILPEYATRCPFQRGLLDYFLSVTRDRKNIPSGFSKNAFINYLVDVFSTYGYEVYITALKYEVPRLERHHYHKAIEFVVNSVAKPVKSKLKKAA